MISQASIYTYTDIMKIFFAGRKSVGFATDPFENKLYFTELFEYTVIMVSLATGERRRSWTKRMVLLMIWFWTGKQGNTEHRYVH